MSGRGWQLLQASVAAMHEPLRKFVVPLYARAAGGVTAVGSGVLLQADRRYLLLTAAHVLDQHGLAPLALWGGPTERFVPVLGEAIVTPCRPFRRDVDHLDVAIVTLDGTTVKELLASDSSFAEAEILADNERKEGIYAFAGYPVADNEPTGPVNGTKVVQRVLHVVHVNEVTASGYRRANRSRDLHFVASYDRHRLLSSSGVMTAVPWPVGMSGGGLFLLGMPEDIVARRAQARLVGIGIEYLEKKKMIVASGVAVLAHGLLQALSRPLPGSEDSGTPTGE